MVGLQATQISMYDYLVQRRDEIVEDWSLWRDAQIADDEHKRLVDECYNEYIRTLDELIDAVLPF